MMTECDPGELSGGRASRVIKNGIRRCIGRSAGAARAIRVRTPARLDNDADGNFAPPFAGALPSTSTSALHFNGAVTALSTNNAADYSITPGAATFTNNNGDSTVVGFADPDADSNATPARRPQQPRLRPPHRRDPTATPTSSATATPNPHSDAFADTPSTPTPHPCDTWTVANIATRFRCTGDNVLIEGLLRAGRQ